MFFAGKKRFIQNAIPCLLAGFLAEHRDIKSGQSIGEVFKSGGWTIDKQNVYFGEIAASPEFALVYTSMGLVSEAGLAVHIYQMWVSKNGSHLRYATITEVHHPDYLDLNQLQEVYGVPIVKHESGIDGIQNTLDAVINVMETYRSATTDCSWPQAEFDTRSVRSSETVR